MSPAVTRRLIAEFASRPEHRPIDTTALGELTDREREVVALVAGGLSNEEIATELYISPATARTHVSRAMIKLNARDRAQLVVLAYESGLVQARRGLSAVTGTFPNVRREADCSPDDRRGSDHAPWLP